MCFILNLFDKLFGKNSIKSVTELKDKLKKDAESNFANQTDQKLLNDITEHLIDNTKFELPDKFLRVFIQTLDDRLFNPPHRITDET